MAKVKTWVDEQNKLSKQLNTLPSDKDRVKLLIKTITDYNSSGELLAISMRAFCLGYLGSLLERHGLNDWDD